MEQSPFGGKYRSEQVAERILKMIEAGELKPGDKLPSEPEFARQLGVSRGILREGMAQLKAQGIITRKPKGGTCILPQKKDVTSTARQAIQVSSFRNIMEMRTAIEQMAAALVVERATDAELEELREIVLQTAARSGEDDLDYYFHYRLVELSRNSIFMSIVDTYFEEIREIRDRNLNSPQSREEVLREHLDILEALSARDKTAAALAVEKHMKQIWHRWCQREE